MGESDIDQRGQHQGHMVVTGVIGHGGLWVSHNTEKVLLKIT